MLDFDRPLFKRLAHNDTGAAAGHQGGILVPKALTPYFPQLASDKSAEHPTVDEEIEVALFVGSTLIGEETARYQYQTWGGTRKPEYRLTENLGALRNQARQDDILLIERGLSNPSFYRLTLHKAGTSAHAALVAQTGKRRWGPLDVKDKPLSEDEVISAEVEQAAAEALPLSLFDNSAALVEARIARIARSRAFKKRLLPLYNYECAVCRRAHRSVVGLYETEAAHIVPRSLKGADDSRNGLALCRSHHWAFDVGLFGVRNDRRIVVPAPVALLPQNAHLLPFENQLIAQPDDIALQPDAAALEWHLEHVVKI